jgi:hypothetical protein
MLKKHIIFMDDICDYIDEYKSDIIESLEDNDEEANDDNIYKEASRYIERDCDDLKYALKLFDSKHGRVLALGSLGLWYGRAQGGKIYNTLSDAIYKLIEDSNTLYYERTNGALRMEARHHDGRNYFTFYEITSKGEDYIIKHECELTARDLHKKLRQGGRSKAIRFEIIL